MSIFTRGFALLWQGQLVSQLGNQAFLIATALFALEATESTAIVGGIMMASTVPLALVGPFAGTIADRYSRRSILVTTDLLRAVAIAALALTMLWQPDAGSAHLPLLIAVAAFSGTMSALFVPAVQAMIPDLVPQDRLPSANSLSQVSAQTAALIGQAIGGVMYVRFGTATLLVFDALTFAYGALATWLIPRDRESRQAQPRSAPRAALRDYLFETKAGFDFIRQRPGMSSVLVVFAGVNFLFMPVFVLLPLYVRDVLAREAQWYGFLLAGAGAGALGGSVLAGSVLARNHNRAALVGTCVAGIAAAMGALALTRTASIALIAFVAIGCLSSIINVAIITTFQSAVPAELRGRVMALVVSSSSIAVPIGLGLGGLMGDLWRSSLTAVFGTCGALIALLIVIALRRRGFRELLKE